MTFILKDVFVYRLYLLATAFTYHYFCAEKLIIRFNTKSCNACTIIIDHHRTVQ